MRHRLEDLGRIMELVKTASSHHVFDLIQQRPKEAVQWFEALEKDRQSDIIHQVAYGLEELQDKLAEIYLIAWGENGEPSALD